MGKAQDALESRMEEERKSAMEVKSAQRQNQLKRFQKIASLSKLTKLLLAVDDQYGGTLYVISDQSNLYFLF